jgi:beta-N-acetylhexosaminidase
MTGARPVPASKVDMTKLETLALGVLFPSIGRPALPRWLAPYIDAGLGGVVLYGRDIHSREQVATLTSALHALRDHVVIATDEEGGDVTRIEAYGGTSVPGNYALGRIDDLDATRAAAEQIGLSLIDAGIDWDLAPAVDAISNPLTPNAMRTFGADRARVSAHSAAWVEGLQATGVSACAKHFPGHGRSGTDAHLATPTVDLSRAELVGWYLDPFRAAAAAGVDGIMVSHVKLPHLDARYPASISRAAVTGLLREEIGYDGVVISDALEMRGVRDVAPLAESVVLALDAGIDALCLGAASFREDVDIAVGAITDAVAAGRLDIERLERANARIARLGRRERQGTGRRDDAVGRGLALRARGVSGDVALRGRHVLVIRLEQEHSPAVGGRGNALTELLEAAGYRCETVATSGDTYNGANLVTSEIGLFTDEFGDDAEVVLEVRSPHRHEWQQRLSAELIKRYPSMVVVDMGAEGLDFSAARGWVRTFGASRACAEAAIDALATASRR